MALITIKESHFVLDLAVLKSRLESEGIECVLKNELTAQVISYIPAFLVELQVDEINLARVEEIMAETGDSVKEGTKAICPECGSKKIKLKLSVWKKVKLYLAIFYVALGSNVPLDKLFKQTKLKCRNCGAEFS